MVIHLEKGETLFIEKNMVVCETGDYEEQEMVLVREISPINFPGIFTLSVPPDSTLYQYPAIYVKYGIFNREEETT